MDHSEFMDEVCKCNIADELRQYLASTGHKFKPTVVKTYSFDFDEKEYHVPSADDQPPVWSTDQPTEAEEQEFICAIDKMRKDFEAKFPPNPESMALIQNLIQSYESNLSDESS